MLAFLAYSLPFSVIQDIFMEVGSFAYYIAQVLKFEVSLISHVVPFSWRYWLRRILNLSIVSIFFKLAVGFFIENF